MRSAALIIRVEPLSRASRDRLVALLADHNLLAIHEDDPTSATMWTAHFDSHADRDAADATIRADSEFRDLNPSSTEIEDDDWARRTQSDLTAVRIGRIIVAPPWDLPPTRSATRTAQDAQRTAHSAPRTATREALVIIEPSRGFGTGHHQSTRLCLALLQTRELAGRTIIDVGTGSGVLAIAAAKLGAAFVSAIDVDPDAVENARENIVRNDAGAVVEAHVEDFSITHRAPADVVTANLTGSLLARGADALGRLVRPAGELIVSGFNVDERQMVEQAFADRFNVAEAAEEDDWWAFVLR